MLRVEDLKILNGKVVTFEIKEREGIVLLGENGSGKSLLLKSLVLLSEASYKSYVYKEQPLSAIKPENFRREVMYVSTISYVPKVMSVESFFTYPSQFQIYKNYHSDFDYKKILEKWKIPLQDVSLLSSGQKQMISILRALFLNPNVLLLDEPTANLDQEKTLEVESLILEWMKKNNKSVVWVSHSKEQISRLGFKTFSL